MKKHLKQLTSILLCLVMLVNLFPAFTYAAGEDGTIDDSMSDGPEEDGVSLTKTVTYDPGTGKIKTVIEAYTTGTVTLSDTVNPADIILVLDVSGSMANAFGSTTGMAAMQSAVNSFIDQTAAQNASLGAEATDLEKHAIAIVTYSANSSVVSGFTTVNGTTANQLKTAVGNLRASGATAVDYALETAADLLSDRAVEGNGAYANRDKVVIVFSDGDPTHGSGYSDQVAYTAVNQAEVIKSSGATIYTIGIFTGADPTDVEGEDEKSNKFLNYVSSNYPKAYGTADFVAWFLVPIYAYNIHPGDAPYNTDYYMAASDASSLTNIFTTISQQIGRPTVTLGESASLVDVVSDYFTIELDGDQNPKITAETRAYLGGGNWSEDTESADDVIPAYNGVDTLTVTGFDFDENYISETPRDGNFYGKKLILTFYTTPNYARIDAAGAFADAKIPTNDAAAILDSESNAVDWVSSPALETNTVTYQVQEGTSTRTVATYYRLPGSEVTLLPKPTGNATYTYSPWETEDVDLEGEETVISFTMPDKDVTLTSERVTNNYMVSYEYRGFVPDDTNPAEDKISEYSDRHTVGALVTHPTVETPDGYIFSGWIEDDGDIPTGVENFTMRPEDLHFYGYFIPDNNNSYKVEYYLMDTKGKYPNETTYFAPFSNVTTGTIVTASIPTPAGFSYDGAATTTANTDKNVEMTDINGVSVPTGTVYGDGELVLKVYLKRNQHTVSYQYDGAVPADANPTADALPDAETYYYGEEVSIVDDATADGYTFSGWRIFTGDTAIKDNGEGQPRTMTMPDSNVVLHGSFTATGNTPYTIEHYFETLDGDGIYEKNPDLAPDSYRTGNADSRAYAEPLSGTQITGFTYDPVVTSRNNDYMTDSTTPIPYGTITEDDDNPLVLKLYYTRTRHTVTYQYTGTVPEGASTLPETVENVKYGETVNIAEKASAPGHTFFGWNLVGAGVTIDETTNSFTMPARDVAFSGHFDPNPAHYTVQHYLQNADGTYPEDPQTSTQYSTGVKVNDLVTAYKNSYNTYTYDSDQTEAMNPGLTMTSGTDGDPVPTGTVPADGLIFKMYYSRNTYSLTYAFEGAVPDGVETPEGQENVRHGAEVTLEKIDVPAGYDFVGWNYNGAKADDPFVMPREDATLTGSFVPHNNVTYTVNYYLQNIDNDDYTLDQDSSYTAEGTTGAYVYGITRSFTGFTFNDKISTWNGHIQGDGKLVLDLYYDRITYNVSYIYFGAPPENVTIQQDDTTLVLEGANPVITTETARYGAPLTVKSALTTSDENYEFRGWNTSNLPGIGYNAEVAPGTPYTMPAQDVEFRGALFNYVVYYNLNGGTMNGEETIDGKSVKWDSNNLLPDGTPVKDGAVFTGWTYDVNPAFITDDVTYSELAGIPFVVSITLDANYSDANKVVYDWGTENIPDGVTLPTDPKTYAEGDTYSVDTTYPAGYTVDETDAYGTVTGTYTFSGWNDPGNGVMDEDGVTITGSWTYTQTTPPTPPTPPKPPVNPPKPPITPGTGSVILTKVDAADSATTLSGVIFHLYNEDDKNIGVYETDEDGVVTVRDLSAGGYYWIEIRPKEGYVLDSSRVAFTISGGKTTELTVTNTRTPVPSVFTDDHYAYIIGRDDGLVHPEANITRAEAATVFFRLLNEETRTKYLTRENDFTDVDRDDWFNTAVSTLAAMKIVLPEADGRFRPNDEITRAEFAQMAARFDENPTLRGAQFRDIAGHPAEQEILIAAGNGWILGDENGNFRPDHNLSRAEIMAIVNRVLQRIPETPADLLPGMVEWPDNQDTTKWYYLAVQEATNSHNYNRKSNGYESWTSLREVRDWAELER